MQIDDILGIKTLDNYPIDDQVNILGILFDQSFDNLSIECLNHVFELSKQIDIDSLSDENFTTLHYDLSNGWHYLKSLKYKTLEDVWNFQMEELTKEIFHLRKAISSVGFQKVEKERQCQIYTNIGNSFSFVGRFIEAQYYWNKAIDILPNFSMAIGNKGNGLFHYGQSLFDEFHKDIFWVFAFHNLASAFEYKEQLHISAEEGFQKVFDHLGSIITDKYKSTLPNLNDFDLGDDKELADYRKWGIENCLFLNPLNDLGNFSVASHDCLNLPTLVIEAKKPPVYLNLYNQIKQEFGTARYSYYHSTRGNSPHFSDIDITLVETQETARYSFYIEQLKISFRLSYSILDKIAYLLNEYLQLGIQSHRVSFKSLWYSNPRQMELRSFFLNSDNWALRGLYWLSKDLYEKENDFDSVLEPDAKEIADLRNFIEHKGLKIVSDYRIPGIYDEDKDISYTISRTEFERKSMNILKLTRAAIMYLSLAIFHEENKKDYSKLKTLPINSGIIPDYMKT